MMGWWEQDSNKWQMGLIAQVGGASGLGAGLFLFQFKASDVPVKPLFLAISGGFGVGGSIGTGISIPYSSLIRQLINPKAALNSDALIYSDLDIISLNVGGGISCKSINHSRILTGQATASAAVIGVQKVVVSCSITSFLIGTERPLFTCGLQFPDSLPTLGQALVDTPQLQGGLGIGIFGFAGVMQYIGVG
jgi:hypothetical protein